VDGRRQAGARRAVLRLVLRGRLDDADRRGLLESMLRWHNRTVHLSAFDLSHSQLEA
jgi:hypothetical protein